MSFGATQLKAGWNENTPRTARAVSLPAQEWGTVRQVAELGPGAPAHEILEHFPDAVYRAFDVSPRRVGEIAEALSSWKSRAFSARISSGCELPLPDASVDLFLSTQVLELLRMDQLYMLCSEARRVVRTGGHWVLAAPAKLTGFKSWLRQLSGAPEGLELTHYISPEDWDTLRNETKSGIQLLVLRRLAG